MIGASGTYGFNNVDLALQPSNGQWMIRKSLGFDGAGHPVYPAVREFTLSWDLISTDNLKQLIDVYNSVGNSGTITACLPEYGNTDFVFKNYSGTTMQEPDLSEYFMGYTQTVTLLLLNIKT